MIIKALPREGFRSAFSERRETLQNQWKRGFSKFKKRVAETLIKPVENEDFGVPFPEIAPKMIKKHYLEKVSATRFQNVGKPYKTNGNAVSQNAKTRCGNPYKTCRE